MPASPRKMEIVQVELGDRSYPIYIGTGLLKDASLLTQHITGKRSLIITNDVSADHTIKGRDVRRSSGLILHLVVGLRRDDHFG